MTEPSDQPLLRAALNRLVSMKVILSWDRKTEKRGPVWEIKVSDQMTLKKSTGGTKSFVHGAIAASAASIDQRQAARALSDTTIRVEAKRRGMKLLDIVE